MLRAKGDGGASGNGLFAWTALFPLSTKPSWLYGTGGKPEPGSGLL